MMRGTTSQTVVCARLGEKVDRRRAHEELKVGRHGHLPAGCRTTAGGRVVVGEGGRGGRACALAGAKMGWRRRPFPLTIHRVSSCDTTLSRSYYINNLPRALRRPLLGRLSPADESKIPLLTISFPSRRKATEDMEASLTLRPVCLSMSVANPVVGLLYIPIPGPYRRVSSHRHVSVPICAIVLTNCPDYSGQKSSLKRSET